MHLTKRTKNGVKKVTHLCAGVCGGVRGCAGQGLGGPLKSINPVSPEGPEGQPDALGHSPRAQGGTVADLCNLCLCNVCSGNLCLCILCLCDLCLCNLCLCNLCLCNLCLCNIGYWQLGWASLGKSGQFATATNHDLQR